MGRDGGNLKNGGISSASCYQICGMVFPYLLALRKGGITIWGIASFYCILYEVELMTDTIRLFYPNRR